jgi:hypothetical protein
VVAHLQRVAVVHATPFMSLDPVLSRGLAKMDHVLPFQLSTGVWFGLGAI